MRKLLLLTVSVVSLFVAFGETRGQEWTRFRGPNGTGVNDRATFPSEWSDADYQWTANLPGIGHSSPVVWGDRLFITSCDEKASTRHLLCISTADGTVLWDRKLQFDSYKKHKNNSFASSTACVDQDHVYVVWHSRTSSTLLALDHKGHGVWEYELGPYLHGQGGATSPIVYRNIVVLAHDQKEPSFLLAVDRNTGTEVWKVGRKGKRACYSTPCVFRLADRSEELVFSHCYEGIVGIDPKNGKQNWHIDVFGRASQRALGSPVVTDQLVMATSGGVGGERQLVAVRPAKSKTSRIATEAWRTNRQTPHVPTPLVYRDWLFLWSDQGIASCLDKVTGETVWKERVGGNYFGSPVCAGGKLYCIDLDGNVVVVSAAGNYKHLGKVSLGEGSKSTPAISHSVMYLRTESRLFALAAN